MNLKKLNSGGQACAGGACPAIYETDEGDFVVQGKQLDSSSLSGIKLGQNENAVIIPKSILKSI